MSDICKRDDSSNGSVGNEVDKTMIPKSDQ